jgi:GxxExxY protein
MPTTLKRADLVYPELSYRLLGIAFEVWKQVGFGHKEKFYQNAVAEELERCKLSFEEQLPVRVVYKGKTLGTYYFDFLVEGKIILELKVRSFFLQEGHPANLCVS